VSDVYSAEQQITKALPKMAKAAAALIAGAQKVEHYEIASYGTLCANNWPRGRAATAQAKHRKRKRPPMNA
jgi:ferritin-like metal-binding protein YciE